MRSLDRYIVRSFLVNYLLALAVLIGMVTLFDLIVNYRSFAEGASETPLAVLSRDARQSVAAIYHERPGNNVRFDDIGLPGAADATAWDLFADVINYYAFQSLVIFQAVSGIIPLLAAGFTMVRMTRHHELTAMLASGVSLYRVAAPIVLVSMVLAMLTIVNQELLISHPAVVDKLLRKHDEVNQTAPKTDSLNFILDNKDNSLLSAREYRYLPENDSAVMNDVMIIQRDGSGMPWGHISASTAVWDYPENETSPAWILRGVITEDDRGDPAQRYATKIDDRPVIYHTTLTPKQLNIISTRKAVDFLSSAQVADLIASSPDVNRPMLEKIMHLRFTQPLMNIIMLLLGIPFLLTREPNRLFVNMFYCMFVVGSVFVSTFVFFEMAGTQLPPLFAAWLPVLIFGPFSLVMLDFIHT